MSLSISMKTNQNWIIHKHKSVYVMNIISNYITCEDSCGSMCWQCLSSDLWGPPCLSLMLRSSGSMATPLQLWGSELSSSWQQGRHLPTEPSSLVQSSTFLTQVYFYSHFGNRSFFFPVFLHRLPSHLWIHLTFKLPAEPSSLMLQKRLAEALLHLRICKPSEGSPFLFLVATGGPDILLCTLTCVVCRTIIFFQEHTSYLWIHCVKWHCQPSIFYNVTKLTESRSLKKKQDWVTSQSSIQRFPHLGRCQ